MIVTIVFITIIIIIVIVIVHTDPFLLYTISEAFLREQRLFAIRIMMLIPVRLFVKAGSHLHFAK